MKNETNSQKINTAKPLAIVTGASSGIGYELAKIFAKNNFNLLVMAEDSGIAEAGDAFRSLGASVETLQIDLSNYEGVEKAFAKIQSMGQPIDSIAMNAGFGVGGQFIETDLEKEMEMIRLNIVSLVHLSKRVLPLMLGQDHGRILFTSSIAGEMPGPYYAVYAASKAFVQSFSEALTYELKDSPVTVTALQPGATDTNFFARADMLDTAAGKGPKADPAKVAQDGFDAMMAGKDSVVSGMQNKIQTTMSKLMPEKMQAAAQGKQAKPNSL